MNGIPTEYGLAEVKRMIDEKKLLEKIDNNVPDLTSDQIYKIAEVIVKQPKLNAWIPCSERLPEKRDWYLAIFKEPDTGFIALPYIAAYLMGKHTAYTTNDGWIIKDCTDICDRESLYHKNLECVAWMPLPDPMKIME